MGYEPIAGQVHCRVATFSLWRGVTEIAKELNITPVSDKIQDYKRNWIQRVNRMPRNRLPRLIKTTPHKAERTKEDL
jgi:hypothetical protein